MIDIVLAAGDLESVRHALVGGQAEGCAILFANQVTRSDGTVRLLVQDLYLPAQDEYSRRGEFEAELLPSVVARVSKRAHRDDISLVFVHSHPGSEAPNFSRTDDFGEEHLARFLSKRAAGTLHAAMVMSAGGIRARKLGSSELARVVAVGDHWKIVFGADTNIPVSSDVFDRQVRAFGTEGQKAVGGIRVAIVGLGGVGAIVAQELVHLGVRNFILLDPDVVDVTNLNRLPNATPADVGRPKVQVAKRYLTSIAPNSNVIEIQEDVIRIATARKILDVDLVFGCTDSHGSRSVLQQISYQYLIPCIDIGTVIAVKDKSITHIFGRAQLLAPGLACLTCGGLLDPNEVRRDMMTAFERQADPYLSGARVPAPAVMSLNGTAASLAVTMFLSIVSGVSAPSRHLMYNAVSSTLRTARAQPDPTCYICSRSGALARGDSWPILGRQD